MNMKKITKILVAILIAVMLVSVFTVTVSAQQQVDLGGFDSAEKDTSGAANAVTNIIGAIIYIARIVGAGVAIVMLIVLAIQYIAASPEGKAEIKKKSAIYITGAVILFAASAILGIIQNFAGNVGTTTSSQTSAVLTQVAMLVK